MESRFDHAVVVVHELAAAIAGWRDAGFTVTEGGRHTEVPSENALVAFADGAYLELLAVRDAEARASLALRAARPGWEAELRRSSAVARRFLPRLAGPDGVGDVCWAARGLARFAAESRRRGFPMTGPVAMSRTRPDGERLEWSLVIPVTDRLPVLIEDVTPRDRRVPSSPAATTHANGARGVSGVTMRVAGVPMTAIEWADVLGARLATLPGGGTRVTLGGTMVTFMEGEPERAAGVTLAGVATLPPAITALGVRGEGGWPRARHLAPVWARIQPGSSGSANAGSQLP